MRRTGIQVVLFLLRQIAQGRFLPALFYKTLETTKREKTSVSYQLVIRRNQKFIFRILKMIRREQKSVFRIRQ